MTLPFLLFYPFFIHRCVHANIHFASVQCNLPFQIQMTCSTMFNRKCFDSSSLQSNKMFHRRKYYDDTRYCTKEIKIPVLFLMRTPHDPSILIPRARFIPITNDLLNSFPLLPCERFERRKRIKENQIKPFYWKR